MNHIHILNLQLMMTPLLCHVSVDGDELAEETMFLFGIINCMYIAESTDQTPLYSSKLLNQTHSQEYKINGKYTSIQTQSHVQTISLN